MTDAVPSRKDQKDYKMRTCQIFVLGFLFATCLNNNLHAQATSKATAPKVAPPMIGWTDQSPSFLAKVANVLNQTNKANDLVQTGDAHLKNGDWRKAQVCFQQALEEIPQHQPALYGMAMCSLAAGNMVKAIDYSRQAIYRNGSTTAGFYENDTEKLMHFALLLNKAGQAAEAVSVYNHAAYALDYRDSQYNGGKPYLKAVLPELVTERTLPAQVRYTPERLQALAETALAHEEMAFGSDKEALAHLRDAVKLYPDSPVTNYYLGEALLTKDSAGAKAAYQKAAQLGDDQTAAAAKERIETSR